MSQPQLFPAHVAQEPARHVDLLPTVLDTLSIAPPDGIAGRSLLPQLAGVSTGDAQMSAQPMYFEALSGSLNRGWAPLRGVIRQRFKYIDLPIPELYDLEHDPKEEHNLADSDRRQVEDLRALVAAIQSRDSQPEHRAETADARQRLRGLGYVTAAAAVQPRYTESDDPKRLIALDALLQEVNRLYFAGDLRGALARCRQLVERRPTMAVSLLELAHLERESGNLTAAIDALRRAARLNPEDTQTISLLGAYLTQAGRATEAIDLLAPYARRDPPDLQVLVSHALALAASRQWTEALSTLAEARRQDPTNAMLRVEAGTVYLMAGDRTRARQEFEAALTLNRSVARAYSSLGVMAAEDGHRDKAIAYWKQALNADPHEAAKLLAFADFMRRSGHAADARPFFELAQTNQTSGSLR